MRARQRIAAPSVVTPAALVSLSPADLPLRLLIVEDELLIAMDLELQLAELGHEVVAIAADPDQALAAAKAYGPELVLMDLRLARGTSGFDAARRLRQELNLRCVFVSASLDVATVAALGALEPVGFVAKPVLSATLRRVLDGARRQ
jgi:CheY-like chemotaxis protein